MEHVHADPAVRGGRPVIRGTGIPTQIVGKRFCDGESVAELAGIYEIPAVKIEAAMRFEFLRRKRGSGWAKRVLGQS